MDFGLGLVLSFTDNASAGMNNAVQSLNSLTSVAENACNSLDSLGSTASLVATSQSANLLGNNFINAGKGMLSLFGTLINKTRQLGSEYEDFGVTLSALGMNANTAIKKLFDFANKSPLEVGDVKDMIVTLQAQGINAFDKTTGAISGTRQEFLAFLTDLKSFKPEVAGQRFNMAIQNYVGSGEKKQMRTVFDMGDIEQIIGHKVSDTAEGRMQDIIEMVEKKGLTGLSEKLATTWSGVASNIDDAFTRIFYSVANDGGVFKKLKQSFIDLAQVIIDLPDDQLASIGRTIGDALNTIVTPLTKVVNWAGKGIKAIINLSQTNPALVKWGIVLTTVAGGMTLLTGVAFKLIGSLASFVLVMQNLGGTVSTVSQVFKLGFSTMASSVLPLVAVIGALAVAWRTDFGGIRTMSLNFVNNVSNAFRTAKSNVDGSIQGLHESLKTLRGRNDFWSNITIGLMQIYGTFKFVAEAWNNYTLSEESFQKAQELGILPLISRILDLKYRFEMFKKGFIAGWKEISTNIMNVVSGLAPHLKGTMFESLIDGVTNLMTALTDNDPKAWESVGNTFAQLIVKGVVLAGVFKVVSSVVGKVVSVINAISKVGGEFSSLAKFVGKMLTPLREVVSLVSVNALAPSTKVGQMFVQLGTKISGITEAIEGVISFISGLSAPVVALVAIIVGSIASFFVTQKEKALEMVGTIKDTFFNALDNIWQNVKSGVGMIIDTIGKSLEPVKEAFSNLKEGLSGFGDRMKDSPLIEYLGLVGEHIMSTLVPVINTLVTIVGSSLGNAFKFLCSIISSAISLISGVISGVVTVITGVVNIVSGILSLNGEKILTGIGQVGTEIMKVVSSIPTFTLNVVSSLFTSLLNIINQSLVAIVNGITQKVSYTVGRVQTIFEKVFKFITSPFEKANNSVKSIMNNIYSTVTGALSRIKSFFSNCHLELPKIKVPHFTVSGGKAPWGIGGKGTKPEIGVNWYARGGVFDSPSVIGVGENGKEAVMPLENNTGWISQLASMLSQQINPLTSSDVNSDTQISPINTNTYNSGTNNVMTKNINNNSSSVSNDNSSQSNNIDNSVTFAEGSIVINTSNAVEDAEKFARMIMEKIKRQKELDSMLLYQG